MIRVQPERSQAYFRHLFPEVNHTELMDEAFLQDLRLLFQDKKPPEGRSKQKALYFLVEMYRHYEAQAGDVEFEDALAVKKFLEEFLEIVGRGTLGSRDGKEVYERWANQDVEAILRREL